MSIDAAASQRCAWHGAAKGSLAWPAAGSAAGPQAGSLRPCCCRDSTPTPAKGGKGKQLHLGSFLGPEPAAV